MKTHVQKARLAKVADLKSNFIKNNFREISVPVNSAKLFITFFL